MEVRRDLALSSQSTQLCENVTVDFSPSIQTPSMNPSHIAHAALNFSMLSLARCRDCMIGVLYPSTLAVGFE